MQAMHYCRYHGYDYARGAVVFATTSTEPRQRVFSHIEGGKAIPTEFGRIALHELAVTAERVPEVLARLRKALEKGYCIVSTFLSPGERALYGMLAEAGAEFVHIKGTAIPVVYRPDIHETPLFAANRLLVLGRQTDERKVLRPDCLALNDAIAQMALASGGAAVYVREGGRFEFLRAGASPRTPVEGAPRPQSELKHKYGHYH